MSKYKVGDYIKVDVGAFETLGKGTRIEDVKVVGVDKYDDTHPYAIMDRRNQKYWIKSKYIVEDETVPEEELTETVRYAMEDGRQLFDHIEEMFPPDYVRGFYIISNLKYDTRYKKKGGISSVEKGVVFKQRLAEFEKKLGELQ